MKSEQIFPTILICLQAFAAIPYLAEGDLKKAVYWTAAAILNAVVTY